MTCHCNGGNCDGGCEDTVHTHQCPVAGCTNETECVEVDCSDDKLCEKHAALLKCDWCGEYFAQLDGIHCAECAKELYVAVWGPDDYAADDADAANKDEAES